MRRAKAESVKRKYIKKIDVFTNGFSKGELADNRYNY